MNKSIISACILGATSLIWSGTVLASDPLTDAWNTTTSVVKGTADYVWDGTRYVVAGATDVVQQGTTYVWDGTKYVLVGAEQVVKGGTTYVWNGTEYVMTGTAHAVKSLADPLGIFSAKNHKTYVVTDMNTGVSKKVTKLHRGYYYMNADTCMNTVFPGICHGVKYTITDVNTGKQYMVVGVKEGTMDVMHGTRVIRYQYVAPVVRAM